MSGCLCMLKSVAKLQTAISSPFQACAAKPGIITKPGDFFGSAFATVMKFAGIVPNLPVAEVAAAMLDQVINGFEKEPLQHDDLARIGKRVLSTARN